MKVITSDNVTIDFDCSQSLILLDAPEGDVHIPFDYTTLAKVAHWMNIPDDPEEPWETLKAMAQASDFLNMPEFLDRTCRRMAHELRGRKPEQIRQMMDF